MGQKGFFDVEIRYAQLDAKGDPLAKLIAPVPRNLISRRC